jgi:hypothetical protein
LVQIQPPQPILIGNEINVYNDFVADFLFLCLVALVAVGGS